MFAEPAIDWIGKEMKKACISYLYEARARVWVWVGVGFTPSRLHE